MKTPSKILVVENDPLLLNATRRSLEVAGYEISSASNGSAALELARATRPNLVLTDVDLDGLDGFEVCRQLKADPTLAGIFVAFFSGSRVDAESRSEGLELGADDYLVRPIGNRELLARVKALLRAQAAEREARQLATHWQSTFDVFGDAILLTDANFTILQCNRTAGEVFQLEPAEMLGKKCYQVVHVSDQPASFCPLERVCQSQRREILTFQHTGRWLEVRVDPILAAEGNFLGTVHVIADITERVQSEQKLRDSEEKYRLLIQNSSEAIYVVQDGLFKFVNRKCGELLGLSEQELAGQAIEPFVFEADLERLRAHHQRVIQGVEADNLLEIQIRVPGNEAVWLSISAVRIEWGGKSATLNFASDITARKQAETALRESEDKFKYVFDHSALGKSITLITGEIQVNQAFCAMLGYTAAELEHRNWQEISSPEDLELTQTEINGLLSGQCETTRFIKRYLHKNGSIVWAEVSASLRRDAAGQPLYFMTSVNDISARRQAEQALQASNSYLQAVLDAVTDAIFIQDAETGQIVDVNQGMCDLYGYSRAEALELSISALSQGEPPYSQTEAQTWFQKARECGPQTFEWRAKRKDGQIFWAEINLRLTVIGGENRFVVVVRDISERKQAELVQQENEQRLRALIDHAPFGAHLYELEADQRLVFRGANQAADLILGLDHRQFIGKTIEAAFPGLSQTEIPAAYRRAAVTGAAFSLEQVDYNEGAIRGVFEIHAVQTGPGRMAAFFRDITERYKAEAALRASEARFHLMFENHSATLLLIDPATGEILDANQGAVKFYGYPKEILCGMNIDQINVLPPEQVAAERQRAIQAQKNYFVFPHKLASGEIRLVEVHSSPIAYQDKQALFSIIHDVTERKQAEKTLQESEKRFATLFRANPASIAITRVDNGQLVEVNEAWQTVTGYSQAEVLGKSALELNLWTSPEQRGRLIARVSQEGLARSEMQVRRKSGEIRALLLSAVQLDLAGGPFLLTMAQDITELKQAEAALRESQAFSQAILDHSPLGISVRNAQGTLLSANAAWQRIWAVPAEVEEVPGAPLEYNEREAALGASQEAVRRIYQTGGHLHLPSIQLKQPHPGGAEWISQYFYALQNEQGAVERVVILTEDITQSKRAEEALKEYNTRLEAAVSARTQELRETQEQLVRQEKLAVLGQLAGGVGHELRNPLSVINNALYFLRLIQPEAGEQVREYLGIIATETRNAEKIITDLLDFSRIKSVDLEPVAAAELFERTLERFPVPQHIRLHLDLPVDLPRLQIDPRQMTQVLGNLVVNACQAMTSGVSAEATDGGDLILSAAPAAEAGYLVISICDTGPGIPPENLKKLFEPLFTTKPRGIGLGLAVSKKLVEANSGRIEVESRVGQGTTFRLILPVQVMGDPG